MPSALYLAMTAAEIGTNSSLPLNLAWMACHFSPYGTGLSNLPQALPAGSMLILNDRTPVADHDPEVIVSQLQDITENFGCSRLLLDFQRPGETRTRQIAERILQELPCPVAVSEYYTEGLDCPIFLPPVPLWKTAEEYIKPWTGREIWLEAALDGAQITVTEQGATFLPCPAPEAPLPHFDNDLCCHYGTELTDSAAVFTLQRTRDDLQKLLNNENIACFVGLYQELFPLSF